MAQAENIYDVLVLGQGAAAYSAALYAARYKVKTAMFGAEFGGETATGGLIENYPGTPQIDGYELMLKMKQQVDALDVPVIQEDVTELRQAGDCWVARAGEEWYQGNAVILAVGRERRTLGIPREKELAGKGVSYCSTCDAPLYRGRSVAVVGGGDSAVKGALLIAKYATQVYIVYRGGEFVRPETISVQRLEETPNIEAIFNSNIVELLGEDSLSQVVARDNNDGSRPLSVDGIFVEIGADPKSGLAKAHGAELNEQGEIVVDKAMRTAVEGLFAAGDVTDASGELKQTITAAAQGAIAATSAYEFVSKNPDRCATHAVGFSLD